VPECLKCMIHEGQNARGIGFTSNGMHYIYTERKRRKCVRAYERERRIGECVSKKECVCVSVREEYFFLLGTEFSPFSFFSE